jgi:hypothetical protein
MRVLDGISSRRAEHMVRNATCVVVASLALTLVTARSDAQNGGLGCFTDPNTNPPQFATCDVAPDCAPVGGIDCTSGICFCTSGSLSPFCPCLAAAPAPSLSGAGLIGLIALLCAVGLFGLWRSANRRELA